MKVTAPNLIRWSGLSAVVAGLIYAGIQPIHPPDTLASVTTVAWSVITPLKVVMCLLFLAGWTGIYARQMKKTGWVGLAGFLLLSLCWSIQMSFIFTEAFVLPLLATTAPAFVNGALGIAAGRSTDVYLGALPALYALVGILYVLGGLLFGIGTLRARVLPRWAGGLLAVASALTPAAAVFPHQIQRFVAVPVAVAAVGLGYALWSQRTERASDALRAHRSLQWSRAEAE